MVRVLVWGSWQYADTMMVDEDVVTSEERVQLRALLKKTGEEEFINTVIVRGGMPIRKCLTAFNVRPVCFFLSDARESLLGFLRVVVTAIADEKRLLTDDSSSLLF